MAEVARVPLMAGNWKMNLNHVEATGLVQKLAWTLADKHHDADKVECIVIPPYTDIRTVQTLVEGDKLALGYGAQNLSHHDPVSGAYTGEISAAMLTKLGCTYVVVGHSERRQYFGETDEIVNDKARTALAGGLTPIICVGEGLDVREEGRHVEHTTDQVREALADMSAEDVARVVIAYEPIWAIGTGRVASAEDAQEVCEAIRSTVAELHGSEVSEVTRVQYGGSVKSSNIAELMAKPDIDGALVGGASLDAEEFAKIVLYYAG